MADLSSSEKADLEELFEMHGGYVTDFSNSTFAQFVGDVINLDVHKGVGYRKQTPKTQMNTELDFRFSTKKEALR